MGINKQTKSVEKVLLIYLAQTEVSEDTPMCRHNKVKRTPSLGLLYLAQALSSSGIVPHIKDQTVEHFTSDELVDFCEQGAYDFIGFYSYTAIKSNLIEILQKLKQRQLGPLLIGGPGTLAREDYLRAGGDLICEGEGDITIHEMVNYLEGKIPIDEVKGISYLRDGKVIVNPEQPLIESLDSLPFPKRDYYPITSYFDYHFFGMKLPYTTFVASRGCPLNCSFCNSPQFWKRKFRLRSPENVLSEIDFLVAQYDIHYIGFKDDMFGMREDWLRRFCAGMIKRKYDIKWSCMMHPLTLGKNRQELLGLMKRAGLDIIAFGLQSAHPRILERINRNAREPGELAKTIAQAKKIDISIAVEFIVGLPGDDDENHRKNLKYVLKTRPHFAVFYPLCVLDGSEIDLAFPERDFCAFSAREIDNRVSYAYLKYYSSPLVVSQNLVHILKKNPGWFIRAARLSRYMAQEIFFQGTRKKWSNFFGS